MPDLSYLKTTYAREKMIESYDREGKGEKMKTGKEIVGSWHEQASTAWFKTDMDDLKERIDAALREARAEGEMTGWENARKLADAILGKNSGVLIKEEK